MLGSKVIGFFGNASAPGGGGGGGSPTGVTVDIVNTGVAGVIYAQWYLKADGFTYTRIVNGTVSKSTAWIVPQVGMGLYEARATWLSGDVPDGDDLSTWVNLGTDHVWGWAGVADMRCQLKIEIRLAATEAILDTATITLSTQPNFTDRHNL